MDEPNLAMRALWETVNAHAKDTAGAIEILRAITNLLRAITNLHGDFPSRDDGIANTGT